MPTLALMNQFSPKQRDPVVACKMFYPCAGITAISDGVYTSRSRFRFHSNVPLAVNKHQEI